MSTVVQDSDLQFLYECSNEQLQLLADFMLYGNDGKKRITEELSMTASFRKNYPNNMRELVPDIIKELQLFGGNTFLNKFRGHGVPYRSILEDVCKTLKVPFAKGIPTEMLEEYLLRSFLVMAVETFMHLDSFMTGNLAFKEMAIYAFSSLSGYLMLLAAVSMLFSITYFLSNMSANNELISLYSAGLSKFRIILPILIMSFLVTLLFFAFNESIALEWKNFNAIVSQEYFGLSGTQDATDTVLYDEESGYLIYADRYSESYGRLYSPLLLKITSGSVEERIEADYAEYGGESWKFENARVVRRGEEGYESFSAREFSDPDFLVPGELFRSQNTSIDTMDRATAEEYLAGLESTNRNTWQERATEYYRRIYSPLAIFVLMFISAAMNYRFKKNVLLFSVIQSLSIAVIYYVADMVFSIMGNQGVVTPGGAVIWPIAMTLLLSLVLSLLGRKI